MSKHSSLYKDFWSTQTSPLHRENTTAAYQAYAQELLNIIKYFGFRDGSVLEIGCGNGALFPHLGFTEDKYEGIDISPSLLEIFARNYPSLKLSEVDAATYIPSNSYDLIFGNAVHQHFSPEMLKSHLDKMLPKLRPNGVFLLANLPNKAMRPHFLFTETFKSAQALSATSSSHTLITRLKNLANALYQFTHKNSDGIGYWYSPQQIRSFLGVNYKLETLGSNFYPYRLHIVITST